MYSKDKHFALLCALSERPANENPHFPLRKYREAGSLFKNESGKLVKIEEERLMCQAFTKEKNMISSNVV